jgi:hypothetical protein
MLPASFAALPASRATRRLCRGRRRRFRPPFQQRLLTSTIISTSPCAFLNSPPAPVFPHSSSISGFGLCSAYPPANICRGYGSAGPATGSDTLMRP